MSFNPNIFINNANVFPTSSSSFPPAHTPPIQTSRKRELDSEESPESKKQKVKLIFDKQMFNNEKDKEIYEKNEEIKSLKNKIKLLEENQPLNTNPLPLDLQGTYQCQAPSPGEETSNYIFSLENRIGFLESQLGEVSFLEQQLYQKGQTIDLLSRELYMKEEFLLKIVDNLKKAQEELNELKNQMAEIQNNNVNNNKYINHICKILEGAKKKENDEISSMKAQLKENATRISSLGSILKDKEKLLNDKEKLLKEKDLKIASLKIDSLTNPPTTIYFSSEKPAPLKILDTTKEDKRLTNQ